MTQTALDRRALVRWRNAITAAFGLGGVTIATWGPRLPELMRELDIDTPTVGILIACSTVGSIAGLGISTPLLGRLGGRWAVSTALLTIAGSLVLMGGALLAQSVPLVALGFVTVGLGIGTLDVLINVEGAAIEQAAAKTLMPLMHAAWSVGAAVGSGIGAACAALGIAPSAQFMALGVVVVVVTLAMARAIPAAAPEAVADDAPRPPVAARVRQWLRGWMDVRLLVIGVVMLGVELGEGSANTWLTLSVKDDHGQTAAIAALFFTIFAASEAATRIFGGPVVDRLGRVATIRWTTALGIAGLLLFILGGELWMVLVGVVLWAVGVSMGFPLGMSAAAEGGGNAAARVSVVASIGYIANLAGPPVLGLVAHSTGLLGALWLVVALMAAAFISAPALRPRVARGAPAPAPVNSGE
ncbi:MFS transporter [Leifsonia naganoensis]|uniref:MFS family permease n=1 Tax=Leifsonia naganoensis TaxID=150025 RepID=A0A853DP58_9MICO|nr:MFS transporter [Leifsonia naganoensis]NYK10268.1 MFS family permease [Leifsonia naganoensis]